MVSLQKNRQSSLFCPTNFDSNLFTFFRTFLLFSLIFQSIVWYLNSVPEVAMLIQVTLTQLAGLFSSIFSNDLIIKGNMMIHQSSERFVVVDEQCTGLALTATLFAAVMALSMKKLNKVLALIAIFIALQAFNILRISHLFYEVKTISNNFDFYHLYVWQLLNFIFSLTIFYVLLKNTNRGKCYV